MNIHQRLLSWRSSQESHRIDPSLGSQLPVTPSHEHFFMSSTSRLQRRPGNNFDPCLRNKVRTRKATSMHLKLQQVQATGRLRPMRPSRLCRHAMSDERPVFAPDSNPREAKSPSHPGSVQGTAAIAGRSVPWRIGARGAGWCCTSTTEFQRVSASSFLPASQSNLTCCSKSILAAGCNMQSVVCTAEGRWHRVSRHISGQKSHT